MDAFWKGYLIKSIKTGKVFPDDLIEAGTYDSTPNQREEIKAYRDDNTRDLTRVTAIGKKTAFSFSTMDHLNLADMRRIKGFFDNGEEAGDKQQRKIHLEYWNTEDMAYKTGWFYRPNMDFGINTYTQHDIDHKPLKLDFVEY